MVPPWYLEIASLLHYNVYEVILMKIIKEIWRGNLQPIAKFGDGVKQIAELERLKERHRETMLKILGDSNKENLEKYSDCVDEYVSIMCEQAFFEGFCLGSRIIAESASGADEIIQRDCCL